MLVGGGGAGSFFVILMAAILYEQLFIVPLVKQKRIVFAANNSRCCECHVAPTITSPLNKSPIKNARNYSFLNIGSTY
jgi:hypothetical protein